ncbi:MAG: NUDIX domain-containing protein [Firmicutes bacterium]|nr:NUDIX domain-containing protein [Bacillota bacterium]
MDLDFKLNNFRFNSRVSAIIYNKDKSKVLLFKVEDGRDYFLLPGGRIGINEDSKSAIIREIKEELDFDLDFELCSIQENFVKKGNIDIMQYCFCYKTIYNEKIDKNEFKSLDNDGQTFHWTNIDELDNIKLLPKACKNLIQKSNLSLKHIIEKNRDL